MGRKPIYLAYAYSPSFPHAPQNATYNTRCNSVEASAFSELPNPFLNVADETALAHPSVSGYLGGWVVGGASQFSPIVDGAVVNSHPSGATCWPVSPASSSAPRISAHPTLCRSGRGSIPSAPAVSIRVGGRSRIRRAIAIRARSPVFARRRDSALGAFGAGRF